MEEGRVHLNQNYDMLPVSFCSNHPLCINCMTLSSSVEGNNAEYCLLFQIRKKRRVLNRKNQAMYKMIKPGGHNLLPLKVSKI